MKSKFNKIDISKIRTHSLKDRESIVSYKDFAHLEAWNKDHDLSDLFPNILKGKDLNNICCRIIEAFYDSKPIILAMGAHVIKCGLSPLIIDLMKRGFISCLAVTGSSIIHDIEIAIQGETSEDVRTGLIDGSFGMSEETSKAINAAIDCYVEDSVGIGEAVSKYIGISKSIPGIINFPFKKYSILNNAYELKIPVTVHISIGADVINMHPSTNPKLLGLGSYNDFKLLITEVSKMQGGGCYLNFGSAVILPEVFLKALTLARNLGYNVQGFTSVNFDMIQRYRAVFNVVDRPQSEQMNSESGNGYAITGHHEIMLPLLYHLIVSNLN